MERKDNYQVVKYTESKGVNVVFREESGERFTLARKYPALDDCLKSLGNIRKADTSFVLSTVKGEVNYQKA